jgi:hypothetical protein
MILHDTMVVCGMLIQSLLGFVPSQWRPVLAPGSRPIEVSSTSSWKLLTSEVLMQSMRSTAQFWRAKGLVCVAISCYIHTWRFSYFGTRNHASDSTIFYSILGLKAMVTTEDFGKPLSTLIWETMFSPWQISVFGLQFVRIELLITC